MITKYGTKLTAVGIAKLANAQVTSNKVQITHIAIGDGNGVAYTPTGAETALKREKWRGAVNKAELGENNTIIVEGIVPASVGGFTMREVGLYDADGDMIAVGNYPETERAGTVAGVSNELILRTLIKVNNASAVDLTINTDLTIATKAEMDVVTQQLEQIAVGGVNLLDDSHLDVKPFWLNAVSGTLTTVNSIAKLEITTNDANAVRLQIVLPANTLSIDDVHTLSFKYKSNTALEIKGLVNATLTKTSNLPVSAGWRIGYFTFKVTDAAVATTLRIYTTNLTLGTTLEVDYFKLERGDRYSDYTPSVNDQYKVINNRLTTVSGVTRYGALKFPSEFTKVLPFELYRDRDGKIKHTLDKNTFANSTKFYVSYLLGSDSNDGLSNSNPVKTLYKALELAHLHSDSAIDIVFIDKITSYLQYVPSTVTQQSYDINKNIRLCSDNEGGTFITTSNAATGMTWIDEGNGVYRTTRSAVQRVLDYSKRDFLGLPIGYKQVATVSEMTHGTYCTIGSTLYIKRFDDTIPNEETAIILPIESSFTFTLNSAQLVIDNVHFLINQNTLNDNALTINGTHDSKAYIFNSSFRYARFNGLAHKDVGEIYVFDCVASDNGYDGLNYHGSGDEFVFEYNCYSYGNGAIIQGTGNATTVHDGMTVLRIGTVGHDCYGPLLADVNGTLSINYDCIMYDSVRSAGSTKAAYWIDNATVTDDKIGKLYLYNCQGGGKDTYTVNSDGIAQIYASGLSGGNIPQSVVVNNI